jgi:cobalt-zinc-cadmium efflux system protein
MESVGHDHTHAPTPGADRRWLLAALVLVLVFMVGEVVAGLLAHSLALLADAGHMLTDAAALAVSLFAARIAARPAQGAMTYGLGRAEILSAQANGMTLLVLGALIVYGAIVHLVHPPRTEGWPVLALALLGVVVNAVTTWVLRPKGEARSLNVEGSYKHLLTDLYGFIATAIAAAVILITGFRRADAIASLGIAALMLWAAAGLLRASGRVMMEAAPEGIDPDEIGHTLAGSRGVVEVHDLHVWEVTSGFPSLSAHVVVAAGADCHALRHELQELLHERFGIDHTTLQVDHEAAPQGPLQIEVSPAAPPRAPARDRPAGAR